MLPCYCSVRAEILEENILETCKRIKEEKEKEEEKKEQQEGKQRETQEK